ncbi:MAG: MSMEG_0565 family glycosyltransferase [Acidimicrobiia bacterium]|nr:MSMEG_0565 family glycosyltransferase [Acidimicrobiia bacterium]
MSDRVAITTYSTKPRGGVVHTLELAESLSALGVDTTVVAMGDPDQGFFRRVDVPVVVIPAPPRQDTLEERVFAWIGAMQQGLADLMPGFTVVHAQDCISARAANAVRKAGSPGADVTLVRTVHHVDDFTTQALIDCQAAAITEPDHVVVVSEMWRRQLWADYGVEATMITNGVRHERFAAANVDPTAAAACRDRLGVADRHLFLTVGGIEPRKGSKHLIEALAAVKAGKGPSASPVLAVVGGHSFQDYTPYREAVLASFGSLGLELGTDVVMLGTVPDDELPTWFHAADSFVFPSLNEGWGLVILEAQAAGLPVLVSDIEVFGEFLEDGTNALMTAAGDAGSIAAAMRRLIDDAGLRRRLGSAGPASAARFSWEATARSHIELYSAITDGSIHAPSSAPYRQPAS